MKYLILVLAAFTTTGYAQDLEKISDLNKNINSGKAFVMMEEPWNKSDIHLNGAMNPDDAGGVCNIEFGPTEYKYKQSVINGITTHHYDYAAPDNVCGVQLIVEEQKAGAVGKVVLSGDCSGFCGINGDSRVFNGHYKLAK